MPSRDGVHAARAIFVKDRLLADLSPSALRELITLKCWFRIVGVGVAFSKTRSLGPVTAPVLPAEELLRYAAAHGIELYASWLIGESPDLGYRGIRAVNRPGQLATALRSIRRSEERSRIVIDERRLAMIVAGLRKRGARVVFTNGVFDLVHIGHLRLLEHARRLGDVLIVGINSDDSTRRIKGPSRPIVSQFARAETLIDLRAVDYCVIFTGPDPKHVLSIVRPQVLAKGCDYPLNRIVGRRFVEGYGGEVVRLTFVDGCSTTATVSRIISTRTGGARRGL